MPSTVRSDERSLRLGSDLAWAWLELDLRQFFGPDISPGCFLRPEADVFNQQLPLCSVKPKVQNLHLLSFWQSTWQAVGFSTFGISHLPFVLYPSPQKSVSSSKHKPEKKEVLECLAACHWQFLILGLIIYLYSLL